MAYHCLTLKPCVNGLNDHLANNAHQQIHNTCIISMYSIHHNMHQYVQYSVPACLVPNAMHAIDLIDHPSVSDEKKGN